ncbi:MAG: class A beta-lactamase-related serine hydrolase [Deinococcales bacterium]
MAQRDPGLEQRLVELEHELRGTLGVVAHELPVQSDAAGGRKAREGVAYRADHAFPAASTIKVFVLQALLEHAAAGRLGLDDERVLAPSDQVTGSGILKDLTPGRRYTLLDLARLMITISDNTATNMLIDALCVESVNTSIARHGWSKTHLAGLLQRPDLASAGDTRRSTTSPGDLADAFTRLWRGELLPPPLTAVARSIYRKQQRTDQLGRFLPYDAYSTETGEASLVIASKSGSPGPALPPRQPRCHHRGEGLAPGLRALRERSGGRGVTEHQVAGRVTAARRRDRPTASSATIRFGTQANQATTA